MIILIVTDLHDREPTLPFCQTLLERFRPDAAFCLGDLTERARNAYEFTKSFLALFESAEVPLLCISGNNDQPSSLELLESRGALIDNRERYVGETKVVGIGYAPTTDPFVPDLRGAILLTHTPPRRNSVPSHVEAVPRFHFAGHFHSRATVWSLGRTTVVQVPSAMDCRAALLRLPEGRIEFISLPRT